MKNSLLILSLCLLSVSGFAREFGGSGIGGGYVFSMVNWCDDAIILLNESKSEAVEKSYVLKDESGALRTYYNGLLMAAELSSQGETSVQNSLTLRSVARGIRFAQILGVPQILSTERELNSRALEIASFNRFLDWYYSYIEVVANVVDKNYYIPYSYYRSRPELNEKFSTKVLEEKFIDVTVQLLKDYAQNFLGLRSQGDAYYPKIDSRIFLMGLSFFTGEASKDLQDSLFSEVYSCQSKKLASLSRRVNSYSSVRSSAIDDPRKISGFALELYSIIDQINSKSCLR